MRHYAIGALTGLAAVAFIVTVVRHSERPPAPFPVPWVEQRLWPPVRECPPCPPCPVVDADLVAPEMMSKLSPDARAWLRGLERDRRPLSPEAMTWLRWVADGAPISAGPVPVPWSTQPAELIP